MRRTSSYKYSDISSFEDFRIEKDRLLFKSKLARAKLNLTYLKVTQLVSVSGMLLNAAREYLIPRISEILGGTEKSEDRKSAGAKSRAKAGPKKETKRGTKGKDVKDMG